MALLHLPLAQITAAHLQMLIDDGARESRYIDYKQQSYGNDDRAKEEFRADISSFANTDGGDIVIGMATKGDAPTAICPLALDVPREKERLEQMARSGLEPQLPLVDVRTVPVAGGDVLIIRVERSYVQPHRVTLKDGKKFWARGATGKFEPDVEGLRAMFLRGPQLVDNMRSFREQRVRNIMDGRPVVALIDQHCLILHVLPFSGFGTPAVGDLIRKAHGRSASFAPIGNLSADFTPNFDGLLTLSNEKSRPSFSAYTQLFQSGSIEAVACRILGGANALLIEDVDLRIVQYVRIYASSLASIGVNPPLAVMVTLTGIRGIVFKSKVETVLPHEGWQSREDVMMFGEVVLSAVPADDHDCAQALRPILDQLANAAGEVESRSYRKQPRGSRPGSSPP
jgi:hypothetical protein